MHPCQVCSKEFTRRDNLMRHVERIHTGGGEAKTKGGMLPLQHPFTMTVSGPTSCGKTFFVKALLQDNETRITPRPQRIVWLYKRWQPLYDVIRATVKPRVEFIQGIPIGLEEDRFVDSDVRNLIILDDLMSTASKDDRINELFTEGSHHRNLSVIAINQNLYYNKDPTQRRNCHYLVIFNSPIDKQQIMTLARQMYPGNVGYFMSHFTEATRKPYGSLLVDLKPTTPESLRLRSKDMSKGATTEVHESCSNTHLHEDSLRRRTISTEFPDQPKQLSQDQRIEQAVDIPQEMLECDNCGLMFENTSDLQNHVPNWCTGSQRGLPEDDNITSKKRRYMDTSDDDVDDDSEEDEYFKRISKRAKANNAEAWNEKVAKYEGNGLTKKQAEHKADKKMEEEDTMEYLKLYARTLMDILQLKGGKMHREVLRSVETYIHEGYDKRAAVRISLLKLKHQLWEHMDDDDDDDDDDDEDVRSETSH